MAAKADIDVPIKDREDGFITLEQLYQDSERIVFHIISLMLNPLGTELWQ